LQPAHGQTVWCYTKLGYTKGHLLDVAAKKLR